MSRSPRLDRPLEVLRRLASPGRVLTSAGRREDGRHVFLDGLLLGAMVGAAIAGSTAWTRWQARRRALEQRPTSAAPEAPPRD